VLNSPKKKIKQSKNKNAQRQPYKIYLTSPEEDILFEFFERRKDRYINQCNEF
jgi:hypothetical protein